MVFGLRKWLHDFVLSVISEEFDRDRSEFESLKRQVSTLGEHTQYIHGRLSQHDRSLAFAQAHTHKPHKEVQEKLLELEKKIAFITSQLPERKYASADLEKLKERVLSLESEFKDVKSVEMSKARKITEITAESQLNELKIKKQQAVTTPYNIVTTANNNVTTAKRAVTTAVATPTSLQISRIITKKVINEGIPPSLAAVFNVLMDSEDFLTYRDIARKVGRSENTARSYINQLRKYGIVVEEMIMANGRKQVRLANVTKSKVMFPESSGS